MGVPKKLWKSKTTITTVVISILGSTPEIKPNKMAMLSIENAIDIITKLFSRYCELLTVDMF